MLKTLHKSALIATLALFSPAPAFAHAELVTATPAPNSTLTTSPTELDLTFSEALDLKFSSAKLADATKKEVATGAAGLATGDNKTLVIPVTGALAAGDYVVTWRNLSTDGHKSKGSFKFTVTP